MPRYVDCTPRGLQTPEGVARVSRATEEFQAATNACAEALAAYLDAQELFSEDPADIEAVRAVGDARDACKQALARRTAAHTAMAHAVAGAPEAHS